MSLDWEKRFLSVLDKHAPFCQRKVRNCHAPYIDKDLRHKMFLRDLHKKRFDAFRNTDDSQKFKNFSGNVRITRRNLKNRNGILRGLGRY